ncbi:MAG TPA: dihydrofolate reductase family protein [Gemmatimonadales bacterium]|jgi:dihydrofolate reductase
MRKIRILAQISLDGVIQAPGGRGEGGDDYPHGGWTAPYRSAAGGEAVAEAQGKDFDLLIGRRTYDIFAGYWPTAGNGLLANGLNAATKYVATHRPDGLPWGPVGDLGTDIMAGVRRVKSEGDRDMVVWGSGAFATALLGEGLVDEVVLFVYPVLLGSGKRFFEGSANPRELALVSTKAMTSGVLTNTYRHVGSLRIE